MVERYIFIKLKDEHEGEPGRAEIAARVRALAALPEVTSLRIGRPADASAGSAWDLSIALCCESLAAMELLLARPELRAFVDAPLAPRVAVIKAWNFEVAED